MGSYQGGAEDQDTPDGKKEAAIFDATRKACEAVGINKLKEIFGGSATKNLKGKL